MLHIAEGYHQTRFPAVFGIVVLALATLITTTEAAAQGGIRLNQTRIIVSDINDIQPLTVTNSANNSYLIQTRVVKNPGEDSAAPFFVTPPLFVLKSDSRQLLRIVPQELGALPTDRESVFYLSVLAIPARHNKDNAPLQLSLGLRLTLKLFYRPPALAMPPDAVSCNLRFRTGAQGVEVYNPTPYHQTFGRLVFDRKPVYLDSLPSMVAPFSSQHYALNHRATQAGWQLITDFGGLSSPACHAAISAPGAP